MQSQTYIFTLNKENNKEGPKIKVDDYIRISKYKNIFAEGYVSNWFEERFVITKVKNTVLCGHMLLVSFLTFNGWSVLRKVIAKTKEKRI